MLDARARCRVFHAPPSLGRCGSAARVLGFARPAVSAAMDWLKGVSTSESRSGSKYL